MKVLVIAALTLTACTAPAAVEPVATAPDALAACDGSKANTLLGKVVDAALKAEAMRLVGARSVRVKPPGAMVTMDYRTDRLNIETDEVNKVVRFACG